MESPVSAPPGLPLHLLVPMVSSDISSPCEQIMVRTRSVGVNTSDVALATEPECLGPCEPGTSVNLEGIVWQETEDGMLVVNVTWRNKTYVGTLLDCTRHDWAPPSNTPITEVAPAPDSSKGTSSSSSSSSKTRAGANSKGRRGSQNSGEHRVPPCGTTDDVKASPSSASKRKNKPPSDLELTSSSEDSKGSKRARTNSMCSSSAPVSVPVSVPLPLTMPLSAIKVEPAALDRNCASPILIDCPHPNCNKKYKHINGLKYHQAHAHTDEDSKAEVDGDSECGEEPHLDIGGCNGAFTSQKGSLSPARSATPKARISEPHSPSPSAKFGGKSVGKKKPSLEGDMDPGALSNDGSEDGPLVADDASNDGFESQEKRMAEKDSAKKVSGSNKPEKTPTSKSVKSARPIAPAIAPQQMYTIQATTFTASSPGSSTGLTTTVVQAMPTSPQLKPIQPKPTVMGEPSGINPALTPSRDKKKKDKKKKEPREEENPSSVKSNRPEDGKSPYGEAGGEPGAKGDGLLNGSSDSHQSRLASIKAEADKIYSFTDNAPSPSIGGGGGTSSRMENPSPGQPMTPLHVVTQNGAEGGSAKTNSPAYSDISDAGEDGEGKLDGAKVKDPEQLVKEGAKKTLFPPQPQSKESPYYQNFETYYSPTYAHSSPGPINPAVQAVPENPPLKIKKEEDLEITEVKMKTEPPEEKKPELVSTSQQQQQQQQQQQPSVIQQRPNMYMQSLYYNQYAYVPPYGYSDQGYHAHLLSTNPAYRQQYEEHQKQRHNLEQQQQQQHQQHQQQQQQQQQRNMEKKEMRDREASLKEEWKHKSPVPPTLTKAPSLTDLGKSNPSKAKELAGPDAGKSVIIPKPEDSAKTPVQQVEKVKVSEGGGHVGKEPAEAKPVGECNRQAGLDPVLWYRQQEAESRMWTYVYPKYSDALKADDERWKDERERKAKEERSRSKEDGKEGPSSEAKGPPPTEDPRLLAKDPRTSAHVPVSSPLTQHQSYIPYMHGYTYSQAYDPSYRGMPAVMMQNYPGSYLPSSYSFSPYGNKVSSSGSDESEKSRASPSCKPSSESKALDILQQHASHYKSKSPTITDKNSQERDRGGCSGPGGSSGGGGVCSSMGAPERGGDRSSERPRTSPSQRLMSTHHHHHHLGYSLLPGQYQLPYSTGLSSTAIVASQQGSAPSLYPPPRR
ncbi:zinc finger protein 609 isoform X2 [Ascaphus truei]|uniref:zinc finger protein 609 isoform X2 n=1 Tax=Ascaphus truei TaxID=8439 RepID=UPI003F5A8D46